MSILASLKTYMRSKPDGAENQAGQGDSAQAQSTRIADAGATQEAHAGKKPKSIEESIKARPKKGGQRGAGKDHRKARIGSNTVATTTPNIIPVAAVSEPAKPAASAVPPATKPIPPKPAVVAAAQVSGKPAVTTPKAPAELIANFERSGQTLSAVPVVDPDANCDLMRLAMAYAHFGNIERALRCLGHVPDEMQTIEHAHLTAQLYGKIAQYDAALEELDRINPADLSAEAARKIDLDRMRFLRMRGNYPAALALGARLSEYFPTSVETQLGYADLLSIAGDVDGADAIFCKLIENPSFHLSVAERYADHLYETNRLRSMELLITVSMGRLQQPLSLLWRKCRAHWVSGDAQAFNATCDILAQRVRAGSRLPVGGLHFFAPLQADEELGWSGMAAVQNAVQHLLSVKQSELQNMSLGKVDAMLGLLNDAIIIGDETSIAAYANAITQTFPYAGRGWYGKALAALAEDDYVTAERALRKSVEIAPADAESHAQLFNVIAAFSGRLNELETLVATRNQVVPKFNDHTPDGRQRFYDHESLYLNFMRGDYVAAYALRNNQGPNRYLERTYPERYLALHPDTLPKKKRGTVCVIGQDGVGDEIRWAQYYNQLRNHFDRVQIACDPRLQDIFTRSFPDYEFTPVSRRWPAVPWRARERREEVPHFHLAGKLSGQFQHKLDEADRIMFPEEVAWHLWKRDGLKGPKEAVQGRYLEPDPALADHWGRLLDAQAGGRLKVGLLWRSGLVTGKRSMHFMSVQDMAPLTRLGCQFVSLQPKITDDEVQACQRLGIAVYDDLDLYDDFENIAAFTAGLDLVIGISTLPHELAAAVGTPVWTLTFAAYGKHIRLSPDIGDRDINTANSTVICGDERGSFALRHPIRVRNAVMAATARLRDRLGQPPN